MEVANCTLNIPGAAASSMTFSLPGGKAQSVSVGPGAEAYVTFPAGTIGGPVKVSSSQLVLASHRVQYNQSLNEQPAQTASEAVGAGFFNWYDRASPGMGGDNIHVFN